MDKTSLTAIPTVILPGGKIPTQGKPEDVGYDVFTRAILQPNGKNPPTDLWNFKEPVPESIRSKVRTDSEGRLVYVLEPKEPPILIGLGFKFLSDATNWYCYLHPRSSTAMLQVEVKNWMEGVPVDPSFKGEPKALIENQGTVPLEIFQGRRLAQIVFHHEGLNGGFFRPVLFEALDPAELAAMEDTRILSILREESWNGSSGNLVDPEARKANYREVFGRNL